MRKMRRLSVSSTTGRESTDLLAIGTDLVPALHNHIIGGHQPARTKIGSRPNVAPTVNASEWSDLIIESIITIGVSRVGRRACGCENRNEQKLSHDQSSEKYNVDRRCAASFRKSTTLRNQP